jgi:RNA polymerase sigma-70 factor (ECF subfamily)
MASSATVGQHDEPHFEDFFLHYQSDIFGYLWRITTEEQVAYDLCQETFLRAWQHFHKISAYEQPGAWLFRVATNLALNHQRQRTSHPDKPLQLNENASSSTDPAQRIVDRDAVAAVLLQLPFQQRMALVLRIVYGMPFEEIADTLGVSPAAAKMTLSRGREQFRRRYQQASEASRRSNRYAEE